MLTKSDQKITVNARHKKIHAGKGQGSWALGTASTKNYDPRAKIIKQAADSVFEVHGQHAKLEIALEIDPHRASKDAYFCRASSIRHVDLIRHHVPGNGLKPEMLQGLFAFLGTSDG